MKIMIDDREDKLIDILSKSAFNDLELQIERLDIGDIVLSDKIAIERKEGFDFVISLVDGRLEEQLIRLKRTYELPLLLIEGFDEFILENVKVKKSSIYGMLSKIALDLEIQIIPTASIEDTALLIKRMAIRLNKEKENIDFNPRIAPKRMNKREEQIFLIQGLLDIGISKAEFLLNTFRNPAEIFQAILNTEVIYTSTGNPKGISAIDEKFPSIASLKGFGPKFIDKNRSLLLEHQYAREKGERTLSFV